MGGLAHQVVSSRDRSDRVDAMKDQSIRDCLCDLSTSGAPMKSRSAFFALVATLAVSGATALDARAGFVPLPSTLDGATGLTQPAAFTSWTYANGAELQFSNFVYTQVTGAPPPGSGVGVSAYTNPGPPVENGLQFQGAFNAPAGTTQDWSIQYDVTVLKGGPITDAYLQFSGSPGNGGSLLVGETITHGTTFVTSLTGTLPGVPVDSKNLGAGYMTLHVEKDISVTAGTTVASISIIDQGFSQTGVPEPGSFALLGIGMTGFLALRRFFKKSSAA
jgi:hypothetical protein